VASDSVIQLLAARRLASEVDCHFNPLFAPHFQNRAKTGLGLLGVFKEVRIDK
jgi:hypothetical protein